MTVTLGAEPDTLTVVLAAGADFLCTLAAEIDGVPQPWPTGTTITLDVEDLTWPATLDGNLATWDVDSAIVDTVPSHAAARLWYVNGGTRQLWAAGYVRS